MGRRPGRCGPGRRRWPRRGGGGPAAWRGRWLGRPGTAAAGLAGGRDRRSSAGRGSSAGRERTTARTPGSGLPRRWHPRARVDREGRWTNPTRCATMLSAITAASLGVIVTGGTELRLRTPTSRHRACSSRSSGQPTGENTEGGNCAAAGGRSKPALAAGPFDKLRAEHERRWMRRRLGGVELGLRVDAHLNPSESELLAENRVADRPVFG